MVGAVSISPSHIPSHTHTLTQDVFVLLDLIGSVSPHPQFHNIYSDTSSLFERFVRIGERLSIVLSGQGCITHRGQTEEGWSSQQPHS